MIYVKEVLGVTAYTGLSLLPGQRTTPEYLEHLKEAVNAPENPVVYLGIDPGGSNGICGYDVDYYLVFMLTVQAADMVMFLHQFKKVQKCVLEGYWVYPGKQNDHVYSDLETPRVIGRIESWAETHGVEVIVQPAAVKATGYAWIGQKVLPKSNKNNHQMDAHVHFMFWAIKFGHIDAHTLLRKVIEED